MDKIEKVKQYLKLSGYNDEFIESKVSNEKELDLLYDIFLEYEKGIEKLDKDIDPIKNYEKANKGKTK